MDKSPIRPTDDKARQLAKTLLASNRHAALGVLHPDTGHPFVSRAALGLAPGGLPMTLISTLALHTRALQANPACSLLVGEPPSKGDPLAFPRLSLMARANFVDNRSAMHQTLRSFYLDTHPKAKLYIDFADFCFVLFDVKSAALNGGFGEAYDLTSDDLI